MYAYLHIDRRIPVAPALIAPGPRNPLQLLQRRLSMRTMIDSSLSSASKKIFYSRNQPDSIKQKYFLNLGCHSLKSPGLPWAQYNDTIRIDTSEGRKEP